MLYKKHTTRILSAMLIVALAAVTWWALDQPDSAPVQAGGGMADMNWMFDKLYKDNYTVTIETTAPINGETRLVVTRDGGSGLYAYASNGIDHMCVSSGTESDTVTHCIPFSNIASFSFVGPLE